MIDWGLAILNAVWLVGLTVLLACLGYCEWAAATEKRSVLQYIRETSVARIGLAAGLIAICLGVGALRDQWWERALWGVLLLLVARDGWRSWQDWRRTRTQLR
jgi:CDP-diglyceride synthetase